MPDDLEPTPPTEPNLEALHVAQSYDPVRYVGDHTPDNPPPADTDALLEALAANLMAKVDAGARLYYALYYHPKAAQLFSNDEYGTNGLTNAYMAASKVFRPGGR